MPSSAGKSWWGAPSPSVTQAPGGIPWMLPLVLLVLCLPCPVLLCASSSRACFVSPSWFSILWCRFQLLVPWAAAHWRQHRSGCALGRQGQPGAERRHREIRPFAGSRREEQGGGQESGLCLSTSSTGTSLLRGDRCVCAKNRLLWYWGVNQLRVCRTGASPQPWGMLGVLHSVAPFGKHQG